MPNRIGALTVVTLSAAFVIGTGCKNGGGALDTPLDPSKPPPGLDTSQRVMLDGAGNPGPFRARLLTVRPDLNSLVNGTPNNTGRCNQSSPWSCFEHSAEICMDAVPNPTNTPTLNNVRLASVFSADGINPLMKEGRPYDVAQWTPVAPGTCQTFTSGSSKPLSYRRRAAIPHPG